jgi:dienelactone hydrolase
MDSSDRTIDGCWAVPAPDDDGTDFPLIVYAHGLFGGSIAEPVGYYDMFTQLAAWGYYVLGTRACTLGCSDDPVSLPGDPFGFGMYFKQLFKVITWARDSRDSGRAGFERLDSAAGVGMCGHSMGGQAALFASSYDNATNYGIEATVLHHAFTHIYPSPRVPLLAFTGGRDPVAPPDMARQIFNAPGAATPRGLVNKKSADHTEPCFDENKWLAQYTASWFKLYLDGTPKAYGVDFHDLIYGNGSNALCGGGDGDDLSECSLITAGGKEDKVLGKLHDAKAQADAKGVVLPSYV